jgi:hypothetical protein
MHAEWRARRQLFAPLFPVRLRDLIAPEPITERLLLVHDNLACAAGRRSETKCSPLILRLSFSPE